ncbi:major facilitator superfamily domain-containing protein [Cladochytrium replicatum]|nr:major facilitator superfamily domain-containing protein [Cladochytrium replicatum]
MHTGSLRSATGSRSSPIAQNRSEEDSPPQKRTPIFPPPRAEQRSGVQQRDYSDDEGDEMAERPSQPTAAVNRIIEKIGMGTYQWKLFYLCGAGWFVDNLTMQALATVLPEVQKDFGISDEFAGLGVSSAFVGMIFGASIWGALSDVIGRKPAFNTTLFITSACVTIATFAPSFPILCLCFALLGSGVGGNLPVDGAIFLEFVPKSSQNLLTLLSLFWPVGQLVTSILGWQLIPRLPACSAPPNSASASLEISLSLSHLHLLFARLMQADNTENNSTASCLPSTLATRGWRQLLLSLGFITFLLFFARFCLFRMEESPKFLMQHGRRTEAAAVLNRVARANGSQLLFTVEDLAATYEEDDSLARRRENYVQVESANPLMGTDDLDDGRPRNERGYARVGNGDDDELDSASVSNSQRPHQRERRKWTSNLHEMVPARLQPLFGHRMLQTTVLVWMIWMLVSVGYTMFNSWLPKMLRFQNESAGRDTPQIDVAYRNYLLISLAALPGSVAAMYLVELPMLGRRGTMALSTFGTAGCMFLFTVARESDSGRLAAGCLASLLQNIMYGVIYSYTPEVFNSKVRGTATGVASALGRIVGAAAPLLSGLLYSLSRSLPLFVASTVLVLAGFCMVSLPIETRGLEAL